MMINPAISIIICTYNRAQLLRRTLMSLEKILDIGKAEVIVIDNHSLDDTKDVVLACSEAMKEHVTLRYVFEAKQGLSAARNRGINEARAPIIAFLDDDALPLIKWIPSIINGFQRHPDVAALGGIIIPDFATVRPDWLVPSLELKYTIVNLGEHERRYPRKLYPFGANMAFRRQALENVQFPEELGRKGASLISGEEEWVFTQLRKKGQKFYYIPDMTVRHYIAEERLTKQWIKRRYYYQGVSLALNNKNFISMLRIVTNVRLKMIYIQIHSLFRRSPEYLFLHECRRESIRGSMDTLRLKGVEPTYE